MLHLHFSNRPEALRDALIEVLAPPPADPFAAAPVIVPNAAVKRWLTLALADAEGICAQVDFAFLGAWLWQQMGRLVPISARSPFAADTLAWRIHGLLAEGRAPAPLAGWAAAADGPQQLALARQIAGVFDTYVTYRGDWLGHWHAGRRIPALPAALRGAEAWQRTLWMQLLDAIGVGDHHPAEAFVAALAADPATAHARLPARVAVFAPAAVAPLYLGLLARLADIIDVHLLALNPCREYWTDTVDARALARLSARGRADGFELGPPLLARWGRQTRALVGQLMELSGGDGAPTLFDDERYVDTPPVSRLAALQQAMLTFTPLPPGSLAALPENDRSLELHGTHSLTRQVEALHDQLLAAFAADPTLTPGQVLVACTDLDAAAPLIEAVFGAAAGARHIPFTLSGRAEPQANPVAEALVALLELAGGRVPASALGDLLRRPLIARRFGLDPADIDRVHELLAAAGVRWGLDAAHRAGLGAPSANAGDPGRHTLADGLQGLLLGLTLPTDAHGLVAGTWPLAEIDDADAPLVDALATLLDALRTLCAELARPAPAPHWPVRLHALLRDWLTPGEGAAADAWADWQRVREHVEQLAAQLDGAGASHRLDLATVRAALAALFEASAAGGVVTGCVTVSALPAFRGVPARVIALLGLDDGVFPGRATPAEFDLIAATALHGGGRPGDRQRRDDDRNLLLDLLLAARDRLLIFHTHRSLRDNTPLPLSPVLAELAETLLPAMTDDASGDDAATARRRLFVEHPLQPFSPALFGQGGDPRRATYAAEYAPPAAPVDAGGEVDGRGVARDGDGGGADDAQECTADDRDDDAPSAAGASRFAAAPLAPVREDERRVALGALQDFLRHPARAWLRRLGLIFDRTDASLSDDEPFAADAWQTQALWPTLWPLVAAPAERNDPADALDAALAASGRFPAGPLGAAARRAEAGRLRGFADRLGAFGPRLGTGNAGIDLSVTLDGAAWSLHGAAADLGWQATASGGLLWCARRRGAGDLLTLRLAHLAACAAGHNAATHLLSEADTVRLPPLPAAAARAELAALLALYAAGQRAPLPLFAKSSLACAERLAKGGFDPAAPDAAAIAAALAAARKRWLGSPDYPGEQDDAWIAQAWRGQPPPFDARFAELAWTVFGPTLTAAETT